MWKPIDALKISSAGPNKTLEELHPDSRPRRYIQASTRITITSDIRSDINIGVVIEKFYQSVT